MKNLLIAMIFTLLTSSFAQAASLCEMRARAGAFSMMVTNKDSFDSDDLAKTLKLTSGPVRNDRGILSYEFEGVDSKGATLVKGYGIDVDEKDCVVTGFNLKR